MHTYQIVVYIMVLIIQIVLSELYIAQISKLNVLNRFIKNIVPGTDIDPPVNYSLPYNGFITSYVIQVRSRTNKTQLCNFDTFVVSGLISVLFYFNSIVILAIYICDLNNFMFLIMVALLQINILVFLIYSVSLFLLYSSNKNMIKKYNNLKI